MTEYDLIVLGGGPAGYTAALKAAKCGLGVALVEKNEIGGVCLNRGCIPTKSLLESSNTFIKAKEASIYGVSAGDVSYDLTRIYERKNAVVKKLKDGIMRLMKAANVDIINAVGTFKSNKEVLLSNGEVIFADNILIATGGTVKLPPIKGIENALTSDQVLAESPVGGDNIVIIGGGVIGVEFATFYAQLGKKVTIIEMADKLIPTFDDDFAKMLALILRKRKVSLVLSASVTMITQNEVHYKLGEESHNVTADTIIVCTGRRADISQLGLDNTTVMYDQRGILVNAQMQTKAYNIYAAGDVIAGNMQLAHVASAQAEIAIDNIMNKFNGTTCESVPTCIYTSPEIASIGMTEAEARDNGYNVECGKCPMGAMGKAVISGGEIGFIKVVVDKKTDRLLGVQIMCDRATDMIGVLTTLIIAKAKRQDILNSIYPHPTLIEAFYEAIDDSRGEAVHILTRTK